MRTAIRALVWLLLVLWLGGVMFFPVTAWAAFSTVADTHIAGTVVAKCLRVLHYEGLCAGTLIIVLLLAGWRARAYSKLVAAPIVLVLIMLGFTAFSQFSIIPRMEGYRIAAGGSVDAVPENNPDRVAFNRLHHTSVLVEEGVMLAGVLAVATLALPVCDPRQRPSAAL
ncbi:hypothetical protein [Paracidobacterium acidisoli]|uniref:DUF4149 domain-containing protein n=1 Tax=Paracidobacterium acidisoli TaxID=2303751 RepID=A0A372IRZ7_9BACT|nr:hypothetical protein [Paracidobacterium acidisoli]MBT9330565.1 hypothetical protein [Paracidobacterium acidisoli]